MKKEYKITIEVEVEVKPSEKKGIYVCYIPMVDSYFGASDEKMIQGKAEAMVKLFCDYYLKENVKKSRRHSR